MQSNKIFQNIAPNFPGKSKFDLSYAKLFTCDMGQLIPIMHDEVVPGDVVKISNEAVVRMQPLVAPILHEVNIYTHYFFVPYRLLWDEWEEFITGGEDGQNASTLPRYSIPGSDPEPNPLEDDLWCYFGFPEGVALEGVGVNVLPLQFPWLAYGLIWNEWYRAEEIQDEIDLSDLTELRKPKRRNWEKDYFTSSLLSPQRGNPVSVPISGTLDIDLDVNQIQDSSPAVNSLFVDGTMGSSTALFVDGDTTARDAARSVLGNLYNVTPTGLGIDIADLRLALQLQKWMERNARAGARYCEFLYAHFGVSPKDERLQKSEYIGGSKQPVVVSEVLQTSSTDATSPQGNLAGHGLSASGNFITNYRVEEYGIIMGLMSIMPRAVYTGGINRQWLRTSRYDFYHPEFANLSEQAIIKAELNFQGGGSDDDIFGYIGRYDEMRTKQDLVCGAMATTFDYWHIARTFPTIPALNSTFLECNPRKDIFAVQDENGFIVHFQNIIEAIRPLPIISEPGKNI